MELKNRIKAMPQVLSAAQTTVQLSSADISDELAMSMPNMYPNFMETLGQTFTLHQIIEHEGNLYRIGQPSITTSTVYIPGATGTESIYSKIEIGGDGYEVWKKWDGISGIYQQDQIVHDPYDNNNLYISKIPNNVWGPPHEQPRWWDRWYG